MQVNFRYGAAAGLLAAAFSMPGPAAASAGQTLGTSVVAPQAFGLHAPATHLHPAAVRWVPLRSTPQCPAWQHGTAIAQAMDNTRGGSGHDSQGSSLGWLTSGGRPPLAGLAAVKRTPFFR